MTPRETLENELAHAFNEEQLDGILRSVLKKPLNHLVASARLPIMITELVNALEMDQVALKMFISHLFVSGPSLEIKGAARGYLDDILGIVAPQANPYKDLIVLGQPFVDRQSFRDKLKDLLSSQYNRALAATGPRYSGRSHSRILIRHVGQKLGFRVAVVDLLKVDVGDAISYLINEMRLEVKDTRDRMAQCSTQTKGFLSVLRGIAPDHFVQNNIRWCIVFDHHDLPETPPERKEFAELMIQDLMEETLPNIWVVMLGLGSCQYLTPNYIHNIMNVEILRLGLTDIESYINDLHIQKNDRPLDLNSLQREREKVLADINFPLQTVESMDKVSRRLRQYF